GRLVRRLPHGAVTAHDSEAEIPRPDRDREVEGADDADHAQRMPSLHHAMARALGSNSEAVELARQPDREVADVDHLLHFTKAFLHDLAGLDRDQPAEFVLVRAQLLAEQADQLAAARGRHLAPLAERLIRARDPLCDAALAVGFEAGDLDAVDRRMD